MGRQGPTPPRMHIHRPIEGPRDVKVLKEDYPAISSNPVRFLTEIMNQCRDYQNLVLTLAQRDEAVRAYTCKINGPSTKSSLKLRLFSGSIVLWGNQFLPIKGKQFDILLKLSQRPGDIVIHQELYSLIQSRFHKDLLLRQYINNIRKAFPPPYCDPHHPEGIIKTRKMEGYYLNLPPDCTEIVAV
ncbi:MAG TPA: hypothetical protein ACFYEM_06280 [Candidatus Hypogeohydataceae bacterium YC40]